MQRLLDENSAFLKPEQTAEQINRLEGKDSLQRLATEWEMAVANAFSKIGRIQWEPKLLGTRKADILFRIGNGEVLADCTTVSDRGFHQANPIELLINEVVREVTKRGFDANKFHVQVEGNWQELFLGGPKVKLHMPVPSQFKSDLFNADFKTFVENIRLRPSDQHSFRSHLAPGISIAYDPKQLFFGSNHLAYTVIFSLKNNPIRNRLEKKATHLRDTGYEGYKGIVLCDGGCEGLSRHARRGMDYSGEDVITDFLAHELAISFVCVLTIGEVASGHRSRELRISERLYGQTKGNVPQVIMNALSRLPNFIAEPEATPINADSVPGEHQGRSFNGGSEVSDRRIKISVRALLEVLSGKIPLQEFLHDHELLEPSRRNFFARMLADGRLPESVALEKNPDSDDDWIEFCFSDSPDPAISRMRDPRRMDSK